MVYGMDGGMNDFMTCISSWKHDSKLELYIEEELLKDKSRSSGKSQLLRDEIGRPIGGVAPATFSQNSKKI